MPFNKKRSKKIWQNETFDVHLSYKKLNNRPGEPGNNKNNTMKTTKRQIADTMTVVNAGTPGNRNATRYAYKSENYVYQGTTGQPVHRIQFDGQCVELDDYCTRERFIDAVYEDLNG